MAVWRSIDSSDNSMEAPWKEGVWRNIYIHQMLQAKDPRTIECTMIDVDIEGVRASMPQFISDFSYALKAYIKAQANLK